MPAAVQMNVRIDPDLKKRGDLIFARHGLSPSQAVRALYESITGPKQRSDEVLDTILERDAIRADAEAERKRKLDSIRRVQDSIRELKGITGNAPACSASEALSDKDLLEKAIFEHYSQKEMAE